MQLRLYIFCPALLVLSSKGKVLKRPFLSSGTTHSCASMIADESCRIISIVRILLIKFNYCLFSSSLAEASSSAISHTGNTGNSFDKTVIIISTSIIDPKVTAVSITVGL